MDLYQTTNQILKENHLQANKALGQNFLINETIIQTIVTEANIGKNDLVIEIGPGLGNLTEELIKRANKVIAIELDLKMIQILQKRFQNEINLKILHEDILKVNLQQLIEQEMKVTNASNVKVVANLPYYISTPIITKLLEEKTKIQSITIMVQKEVAERIAAQPGDKLCGSITYLVHYYAEVKTIVEVSKNSFIPAPNVESKVIMLKIRSTPKVKVDDEEELFTFIKLVFSQRRKTLSNVLLNMHIAENKEQVCQVLSELNIGENVRAETLSLEKFAELKKLLEK